MPCMRSPTIVKVAEGIIFIILSLTNVREAILQLEDLYRLPITLFYIEGFSIREIANILKVPEGTVKSRLHTGRSKLKGFLTEEVHA